MAERPPPARLGAGAVGLVLVGGTLGTAAREALTLASGPVGSFPATILVINVGGALLLGVLLESLARRGGDTARALRVRLLAGTGFLGGFTTYSALATDTGLLAAAGSPTLAVANSLGTLVLGAAATWAGIVIADRLGRARGRTR